MEFLEGQKRGTVETNKPPMGEAQRLFFVSATTHWQNLRLAETSALFENLSSEPLTQCFKDLTILQMR